MYVGLTKNPAERRSSHKRKKPPHIFNIIAEFNDLKEATNAEREYIKKFNCIAEGWNISPGGDYDGNSGYNRKGIGGVKKGTLPWNYKRSNSFSEETKKRWSEIRKGKIHSSKLNVHQWDEIKNLYRKKPYIEEANTISKNGRILPYKRAFSKKYAESYGVTAANIYRILKNED